MLRYIHPVIIATLLLAACRGGLKKEEAPPPDLYPYANPLVGTDSRYEFSNGNTYPAITMPWGMTCWTPQTAEKLTDGWIYQYHKDRFYGLRSTHQPSPWIGDYGQILLMPGQGGFSLALDKRHSSFSHENEQAQPNYYKVLLDDNAIEAELSPTMRCASIRVRFPAMDTAHMNISAGKDGMVKFIPEENKIHIISYQNSGGTARNFACYYVIMVDKHWLQGEPWIELIEKTNDDPKAMPSFSAGGVLCYTAPDGLELNLQVGSSFISFEQAEANLKAEIGEKTLEEVAEQGKETWNKQLRKVIIEGASEEEMITFYTALYRSMVYPRTWAEPDTNGNIRHRSPYDGNLYPGEMFTDNGFWDTYRAVYPLYTLLCPTQNEAILRGYINTYEEGGWFPKWTSPGYRDCMIGTHVVSLMADAHNKGLTNFSLEKAYEASVKDAEQYSEFGGTGRTGLRYYNELGYVPADRVSEATARTLEFAYDDFCLSELARALDKSGPVEYYLKRSLNYKNVFDPNVNFMRGKLENGNWEPNFDPYLWGDPFTEASAWHYTFSVPHDPAGLIRLMGGPEAFTAKLDSMFTVEPKFDVGSYGFEIHEMTEMVACKMGQYAHGNQPVHHVLYLYNWAGQPWKTQARVREAMNKLYGPGPDGLCGDEDNGQMSAWYVFSSLGFYPVSPGRPYYAIGSPKHPKATVKFENGNTLEIIAKNQAPENVYIQSIEMNGKPYDKNYFLHKDLIAGGSITFTMGPEPNTKRGTGPDAYPFSVSTHYKPTE